MAKTAGFDPHSKVKICFACKVFDVAYLLLASTEKMVPKSQIYMRPFQWNLKDWKHSHLRDSLLSWSEPLSAHLGRWQNSHNIFIPKTTGYRSIPMPQTLDQDSVKGLVVGQGKRQHINVLELNGVFLTLKQFRNQCQNQTVLIATFQQS